MIFVDIDVVTCAVGRTHPRRAQARHIFLEHAAANAEPLCTSAEVVRELLHADLPAGRTETLETALTLLRSRVSQVRTWSPPTWGSLGASRPDTPRSARALSGTSRAAVAAAGSGS